jgi:phage terminase small subunit
MNKLTKQQELFVIQYMVDFNATQAAISANYAKGSAHVSANRLLKMDKVQAAIQKRLTKKEEICDVKIKDLINELAAIATLNIADIAKIDTDGKSVVVKDFNDIPDNAKKAIKEIQTIQIADGGGVAYKIQFYDKMKGIELLGKHFGMFIERTEIGKPGDFDKLSDKELDARIAEEEKNNLPLNVTGAEKKKGQKALNPVHPVH